MTDAFQSREAKITIETEVQRRHRQPDLCTIYQSNATEM